VSENLEELRQQITAMPPAAKLRLAAELLDSGGSLALVDTILALARLDLARLPALTRKPT
jgi:hypothetical protein